jgi:hypothetical protein
VGTACYLVNISPSSTLDDKTPQEVWTGKEPSLTHLKVFGCDAYVHVPKENKSKLDKKAEKCIFIGYKDGLKGYKLWNPKTKKVVYSRDVVFREMKDVKHEVLPSKEELEKIEFDLKDDESDSTKEHESEEEDPHTPVLRRSVRERRLPERYTPSDFRSNFALSITDDDPRIVREAVDSEDGNLWKRAMEFPYYYVYREPQLYFQVPPPKQGTTIELVNIKPILLVIRVVLQSKAQGLVLQPCLNHLSLSKTHKLG